MCELGLIFVPQVIAQIDLNQFLPTRNYRVDLHCLRRRRRRVVGAAIHHHRGCSVEESYEWMNPSAATGERAVTQRCAEAVCLVSYTLCSCIYGWKVGRMESE